mmetsp:Transcript_132626/g.330795  ORF Transcript_132626/g.330795 Transcript_132626/m.330795 type:complete len:2308 (-) Transcript_132626:285-7208(-)
MLLVACLGYIVKVSGVLLVIIEALFGGAVGEPEWHSYLLTQVQHLQPCAAKSFASRDDVIKLVNDSSQPKASKISRIMNQSIRLHAFRLHDTFDAQDINMQIWERWGHSVSKYFYRQFLGYIVSPDFQRQGEDPDANLQVVTDLLKDDLSQDDINAYFQVYRGTELVWDVNGKKYERTICNASHAHCPARIALLRPEEYCELNLKECRYTGNFVSEWFFRYCMDSLGWSIFAGEAAAAPQQCSHRCPAVKYGTGDKETYKYPTVAGRAWADLVKLRDRYFDPVGEVLYEDIQTCDELAFALHRHESEISKLSVPDMFLQSPITGSDPDGKLLQQRSLDCRRMHEWLNCNCGLCNSWQVLCGCRLSQLETSASTCRDASGNQRAAILESEDCTVECRANFSSHISTPLKCLNRHLMTEVLSSASGDGDVVIAPAMNVCYNSTPEVMPGNLSFADEDPRESFVGGLLKFDVLGASRPQDLAGFSLYWGADATSKLGGRIAYVSALEDRPVLHSASLPAAASHLLAFPENAVGEASEPWAAVEVWDLHLPSSITGSSLEGAAAGGASSLVEVLGPRSTRSAGPGEWFLHVGARGCDAPGDGSSGAVALPDTEVTEEGSAAIKRLGWNIPVAASAFHVLCQRAHPASGLIARAIWWAGNLTVSISYKKVAWIAGEEELIKVRTSSAFALRSWLTLVPIRTPINQTCGASRDAHTGRLVSEVVVRDEKEQQWQVRPKIAGMYQLCWASCFAWPGAACQSVLEVVEVKESSCFGNGAENHTRCGSPSGAGMVSVAKERSAKFTSCADTSKIYDPLSIDIAPDGSYMIAAVPCLRAVLRLDLNHSASQAEVVLPFAAESEKCNHSPFDAIPNSPRCAGYDASITAFMHPVAVRIAPSDEFWLVVDAYAHRVLRVDLNLSSADRRPYRMYTIVGSGAAVGIPGIRGYTDRAPVDDETQWRYRLSCSNFTLKTCNDSLDILEGTFMGDGGPPEHAHLDLPWDITFLPGDSEAFLIVDRMNHRIRRVSGGTISTVAGVGPPVLRPSHDCTTVDGERDGDGGPATAAQLREPIAVTALPGRPGAFAIAEAAPCANRVRWVDECRTIRTLVPARQAASAPWQLRSGPSGEEVIFLQSRDGMPAPQAYSMPLPPKIDTSGTCGDQRQLEFIAEDGLRNHVELMKFPVGLADLNGIIYILDAVMQQVYTIGDFGHRCVNDNLVFDREIGRCRCKEGLYPNQASPGSCLPVPVDFYYTEVLTCPDVEDADVEGSPGGVVCACPSGSTSWRPCASDIFVHSHGQEYGSDTYVMYDMQVLVQGFSHRLDANGVYNSITPHRLDRPAVFEQIGPNASGKIFWDGGRWLIGPDWSAENAWASKESMDTVEALVEAGAWATMHDMPDNVTVWKPALHVTGFGSLEADGVYFSVGDHTGSVLRYIKAMPSPEIYISWAGSWFVGYDSDPDHASASKPGKDSVDVLISPGTWEAPSSQEVVAASVSMRKITLPPRLLNNTVCIGTEKSASISQCTCKPGYASASDCAVCAEGLLCPPIVQHELAGLCTPGSRGRVRVDNNFWGVEATLSEGPRVYPCRDESHCWWATYVDLWNMSGHHACDRVQSEEVTHCAAQSGLLGQCLGSGCLHHRTGFGCGRCQDGYYEELDGTCAPCGNQGELVVILLLRTFTQLVALSLFYNFLNNPKGGKFMATYMLSTAAASFAEFLQQYNFLRAIGLALPVPLLDGLMKLLLMLSFSWKPLACAWNNAHEARFPARAAWPFLVVGLFLLLWILSKLTAPLRRRLPDHPHRAWGVFRPTVKTVYSEIKNFKVERDKALNTFLFIIAAMYINIVRTSFALFQTEKRLPVYSAVLNSTSGGSKDVLLEYPDVVWFHDSDLDSDWLFMLPFGIVAVLLTIGIYLFHVGVTYYAPRGFATNASFRNRQKYFYAKFREDRYYWGMIAMTKGLVLNLMALVRSLAQQHSFRIVTPLVLGRTIFTINLVLAILLCTLSPYKVPLNSYLDAILHVLTLCIMAGLMEKEGGTAMQERDLVPLIVSSGVAWLLPALFLTARLVYGVILRRRFDQAQEDACKKLGVSVLLLANRVRHLHSATILKLFSGISPAERLHILKGIAVLDSALGTATRGKSERPQSQAPQHTSVLSKLSRILWRRRPATSKSKSDSGRRSRDSRQVSAPSSGKLRQSGGVDLSRQSVTAPGSSTQGPSPAGEAETKANFVDMDAIPSECATSTKVPVLADPRSATTRPGPPRLMGSAQEAADTTDGHPEPRTGDADVSTAAPTEAQDHDAIPSTAQPSQAAGAVPRQIIRLGIDA